MRTVAECIGEIASPFPIRYPGATLGAMLRGRESELAMLTGLLGLVRQGRGGALELDGEAGMGKTALLTAVSAAAADFLVLRTEGVAAERSLPLAGLHQLLRPIATHCDLADIFEKNNAFALYSSFTGILAEASRPGIC